MKKGDLITTPRFLMVKVGDVFESEDDARSAGYSEPTHYGIQHDDGWDVLGKSFGTNKMVFAAYRKEIES